MSNLPAHLANRPSRGLAQRATEGMGSRLPPRISIQGNTFTLIDASGAQQDAGSVIEAVIADIGDVLAKRFMDPDKPWTPDSNDPPLCWSSNGIGPSIEAATPQAATCAQCPNNVRGSAVSKISGAAIKACRDEKYLALLLPKYPGMLFRLVITPGSFQNWDGFTALFKGRDFDMDTVLTQFSFVPKINGVLQFKPLRHNEPDVMKLVDAALVEKKTDVLVGRLDRPRGTAPLPTDGAPFGVAPPAVVSSMLTGPVSGPMTAPASDAFPSNQLPAEPAPVVGGQAKRRGRPPKADPAPATNTPPAAFGAGATAPFMPSDPPTTGNSGFGIQQGAAPNADMQAAIDNMFGPQ